MISVCIIVVYVMPHNLYVQILSISHALHTLNTHYSRTKCFRSSFCGNVSKFKCVSMFPAYSLFMYLHVVTTAKRAIMHFRKKKNTKQCSKVWPIVTVKTQQRTLKKGTFIPHIFVGPYETMGLYIITKLYIYGHPQ